MNKITLIQTVAHMSTQNKVVCDLLYHEYTIPDGFIQTRHIDKAGFISYEVDMTVIGDIEARSDEDVRQLKQMLDTVPEGIDVIVITVLDDV